MIGPHAEVQAALNPLVIETALRYEVDHKVIDAIITQESHWDAFAIRYEEKYPYLLNPLHYAELLSISLSTETELQKMSWGLGQVMGAMARELGFNGPMGLLLHERVNIDIVCRLIQKINKVVKTPEEVFATYNGGHGALDKVDGKFRNQAYVDSAMEHYKEAL
jgi:soluble lytic murein transglycosylase-like protein